MENRMQFFTATCLYWQTLLGKDSHKEIVMNSLKFLVENERIWLYAFVLMPNHIHLLWQKKEGWAKKNIQQLFLKFTAQQLKFRLMDDKNFELEYYKSTQNDREYNFWERRSHKATMYDESVAKQKIDYIHNNPVKAGLCERPEDYKYSSARFYKLHDNEWRFLTHYQDYFSGQVNGR